VSSNCKPVLLEPIMEVEVWTPDDYQGAVMGDISSRRGHILGTEKRRPAHQVKALVPEAELDRYATTLHSLTHGRGTYRMKFTSIRTPPDVTAKVTEGGRRSWRKRRPEMWSPWTERRTRRTDLGSWRSSTRWTRR